MSHHINYNRRTRRPDREVYRSLRRRTMGRGRGPSLLVLLIGAGTTGVALILWMVLR